MDDFPEYDVAQVRATKTVAHSNGAITEEQTDLMDVISEKPLGAVNFACGRTKNLGNFESVKFSVGITVPTTREEIDANMAFAREWVDQQMASIEQEIDDDLKG